MMRSIRFCLITTFFPPYNFGGDGMFVHRLANGLAQRGHRVDVVHCVDSYRLLARGAPTAPHVTMTEGVRVHRLKSRLGFMAPLATHQTGHPVFNAKKIRQILSSEFDVIHFHNISLLGGPAVLGFGRALKLATLHDYWMVCQNHALFKYNRKPCRSRNCLLCSIIYKRPLQLWRYGGLLKRKLNHLDLIITPSIFIRNLHRAAGIETPMVHLPNFGTEKTEPGDLRPDAPHHEYSKPYFLFVGRLEKNKGLQSILPVFKENPQADLFIAGKGVYERRLRKLANGAAGIHFLGFQPSSALKRLYAGAVALIVPSLWYENFPLVILESFAQGTPVIARNIGALPEVIGTAGGGVLFETGAELSARMNQLLESPPLQRKLGANARRAYEKHLARQHHLTGYLGVINRMLRKT